LNLTEVHKLEIAKPNYHPDTSGVSQRLVLFNLFIIKPGNQTECTLCTLADESKLKGGGVMVRSR